MFMENFVFGISVLKISNRTQTCRVRNPETPLNLALKNLTFKVSLEKKTILYFFLDIFVQSYFPTLHELFEERL